MLSSASSTAAFALAAAATIYEHGMGHKPSCGRLRHHFGRHRCGWVPQSHRDCCRQGEVRRVTSSVREAFAPKRHGAVCVPLPAGRIEAQ